MKPNKAGAFKGTFEIVTNLWTVIAPLSTFINIWKAEQWQIKIYFGICSFTEFD